MKSAFLLVFFAVCLQVHSQSIVVSEYFNASDPAHEWTELLVTGDNVSMAGYYLTDNSSSQDGRQGGIRFKNIPLWQHVRQGTILVIHHRSEGATDIDASDGFLEMQASDTAWFDQVKFSTSNFEWNIIALNIAQAGEIIELLSPDSVHIHSLSHSSSPGPYYVAMADPKPNYPGNCSTTGSISIQPGTQLSDYATSGKTVLSTQGTLGLPNGALNREFWRSLRQPEGIASPSISITPNDDYTHLSLSWQPAPDPYPADGIQNYLLLRNTTPLFTSPTDGKEYQPGQRIDQSMVVAILSSETTFTDTVAIQCGQAVYYCVYSFRYGADHQGNSDAARGPAYNEDKYAGGSVLRAFPGKAMIVATTANVCEGDSTVLIASPAGMIQWMLNNTPIPGATQQRLYATQAGQYRTIITATNGCTDTSAPVNITRVSPSEISINITPSALSFPLLRGCSSFSDTTLMLTNTGTKDISLVLQTTTGFELLSPNIALLPAGRSIPVRVRFTPIGEGKEQGVLSVQISSCTPPITVALDGEKQGDLLNLPDSIECGNIIANCSDSLSLTPFVIQYTGIAGANVSVADVFFSSHTSTFQTDLAPGTLLISGLSSSFHIRFVPQQYGEFLDTLFIRLASCTTATPIVLHGRASGAHLSPDYTYINFGVLPTGQAKNAIASFTNDGIEPLMIDHIEGVKGACSILSTEPLLPALLPPGSKLVVTIRYEATGNDTTVEMMYAVTSSPCQLSSHSITLYGGSVASPGPDSLFMNIAIPPVVGSPGQRISIPVVMEAQNLETAHIHSVVAGLHFNGSLLLPDSVSAGDSAPGFIPHLSETHPGSVVITLESQNSLLRDSGILFTLYCQVLLGNARSTALQLDSLRFPLPARIEVLSEGPFTLTDTCTTQRLIDISGKMLFQLAGNPVQEKAILHCSTATDDPVSIELYNMVGQREVVVLNGRIPSGGQTIELRVDMLSGGTHYLVMRANARTKVIPMIIER